MIRYRRRGIDVGEVYFEDEPPVERKGLDVLRIVNVLEPRAEREWSERHTLVVDLTDDEDALLGGMSKGTRYEIRRAIGKDPVAAEVFDAPDQPLLAEFQRYYDEFARTKAVARAFGPRLDAMAAAGALVLTRVSSDDGVTLAWHAYAAARPRAMLLYSASLFRGQDDRERRSLMGRANRYLHWSDMRWFKAGGFGMYDLGGIDVAGRSSATASIASFKRGFGGEVRSTHTASVPASAKGRVALRVLRRRGIEF